MTPLDKVSWERLVWDTNRLRRGTQRTFHTSAQERAGAATIVTPRAAEELAGLIDPDDIEGSLEQAYRLYTTPEKLSPKLARRRVRDAPAYIRMNIWWAEEWLRPDSPYSVKTLSAEEREQANELLGHLARARVFPEHNEHTIANHADAVIVCETAALRRRYVLTENMKEAIGIGQWTREMQDAGLIDQTEIVLYADDALRRWCIDHRGYACEAVTTAFWPADEQAGAIEVERRTREMIVVVRDEDGTRSPPMHGARLVEVAEAARRELDRANDWPGWVERMRPTLPRKTRSADRRHPAHPANGNRDWTRPTDEHTEAMSRARWKIDISQRGSTISEIGHDGQYKRLGSYPTGTEHALAEFCIEHDIEVGGTPRHHGRRDGSGSFTTALVQLVEEQRARGRARQR